MSSNSDATIEKGSIVWAFSKGWPAWPSIVFKVHTADGRSHYDVQMLQTKDDRAACEEALKAAQAKLKDCGD